MPEEKKKELVALPGSLLRALYTLQQEPADYEWGGGIDFEIIAGRPQVERVLAYLAEPAGVPERVVRKYARDVEVIFHTHPRQALVQPSMGDILGFISSSGQVSMIIAGEQIGLLEKRPDHKALVKRLEAEGARISMAKHYDPEWAMPLIKEELDKVGIDMVLYTRGEDSPTFNLDIVRRLVSEEHVK